LHVEGDIKRNSLEEPGHNNWDMGLIKGTRIGEHLNTQFRAEAYNVWNHTQFGDASASLQPGSFGVIGTLGHDPRVLQLSLKLMF
jgi:hypothetical protein